MSAFSERAAAAELMDDPACCPRRLLRTVDQFALINRWFSRYRTILHRWVLEDMAREPLREFHLVDVGAGGCDIARWLLDAARRRGLRLRVTALDADPRIVAHARAQHTGREGLTMVCRDVLDPAGVVECDYLFANHFLHHLSDEQIRRLIEVWHPAVRRRLLFSDLKRDRWSYVGYGVFSLLLRDSFARYDGLLSIRRGFSVEELNRFGLGSGRASSVCALRPGRLLLRLDRPR